MADPEIKELKCDATETATGTVNTEETAKDCDSAWDEAKEAARTGAAREALKRALKFKCPEKCPERIIELSFTLADPKCTPGHKECKCTGKCEWSVSVKCVKGKASEEPGEDEETIDVPQLDKEGHFKVKRLPCSEERTVTGQGQGSAEATDQKSADATALRKAEDDAYDQILTALQRLKCPSRCPRLKVTLEIGPASIGRQGTTEDAVNEYFYATASCKWHLVLLCS